MFKKSENFKKSCKLEVVAGGEWPCRCVFRVDVQRQWLCPAFRCLRLVVRGGESSDITHAWLISVASMSRLRAVPGFPANTTNLPIIESVSFFIGWRGVGGWVGLR